MMSVRRAVGAAGVGMSVGLAVTGGWAWACTPQPRVVAASAESGPPGKSVVVRGEAVAPAGPIELRWNAVRGPVVAATLADADGRFSSEVRIPEVPPGVHTIFVVAGTTGVGRTPFEVTPSSTSTAPKSTQSWSASPASTSRGEGGLAVAAGLLGLGAALASGAAVAAIQRRKALAYSPR